MIKRDEFRLPTLAAEAGMLVTAGAPMALDDQLLFSLEVLLAEYGLTVIAGSPYTDLTVENGTSHVPGDAAKPKTA